MQWSICSIWTVSLQSNSLSWSARLQKEIMTGLGQAAVLLMVCLCGSFIHQTVALQCYQCNSPSASQVCGASDDDGGSNEDDYNDDEYDTGNSTTTNNIKDGCDACDIETKTHKNGKKMYMRRCVEGNSKKAVAGCTFEGENRLCTTVCYTDLCNTGATLQAAFLSIVSILSATVITKYCFWNTHKVLLSNLMKRRVTDFENMLTEIIWEMIIE